MLFLLLVLVVSLRTVFGLLLHSRTNEFRNVQIRHVKAQSSRIADLTVLNVPVLRLYMCIESKHVENDDDAIMNEYLDDDANQENSDVGSDSPSGQFKLGKGERNLLQGEQSSPSAFRTQRQPLQLSDNLIVIGSTVLGLACLVGLFLFMNKDAPPPPY